MNERIGIFAENYGNAFFIISLQDEKALYINKTGRELFGITAETCDFQKIFTTNQSTLRTGISRHFSSGKDSFLKESSVRKGDGTHIKVDLQIGYFDEQKSEIYLELIIRRDMTKEMAEFQVDKSLKAEAIVEKDADFTLIHCNHHFYTLFSTTEQTFSTTYQGKLGNTFQELGKEEKLKELHEGLEKGESYKTELQILTKEGDIKWVSLHLQKRNMGESGQEKIMVYLSNIDEKVETYKKMSTLEQYMSIVQESTSDIVFRVDLKTTTFYHSFDFGKPHGFDRVIPDFVNVFIEENIVHPEDKQLFLYNLEQFNLGENPESHIRFSIVDEEYQWYKMSVKFIYDSDGLPQELMGTLVNVHKQRTMEEEVTSLHQYFEVFQEISGESFYSVDVKNKTLLQKGKVAEELGFVPGQEVKYFPESVINRVHISDIEAFLTYTYDSMEGIAGSTQVRMQTAKGDYQWYAINCGIVRGEFGEVVEVLGKIRNIHKEKSLESENSTLTQYYQAVRSFSGESMYIVDVKTKILHSYGVTINELGLPSELTGYPESVYEIIHPSDIENFKDFTIFTLEGTEDGTEALMTLRIKNKDRHYQWYELKSMVIRDEQGAPKEVLGKIKNIQQQKDLEARLNHDLMSNILNRQSFEESADYTMKNTRTGTHHALIFVDIDDFKEVNNSFGHEFGDNLLFMIGQRMKHVVRDNDLIGSIEGDKFAVMLKYISKEKAAAVRVDVLKETLQKIFSFEGKSVEIKASIGYAIYPQHGITYEELLQNAKSALSTSKSSGKNKVTLYETHAEQ